MEKYLREHGLLSIAKLDKKFQVHEIHIRNMKLYEQKLRNHQFSEARKIKKAMLHHFFVQQSTLIIDDMNLFAEKMNVEVETYPWKLMKSVYVWKGETSYFTYGANAFQKRPMEKKILEEWIAQRIRDSKELRLKFTFEPDVVQDKIREEVLSETVDFIETIDRELTEWLKAEFFDELTDRYCPITLTMMEE